MIPRIPYDTWMAGRLGLEKLTRADLEAHQLERLNRTLVRAKNLSPFYSRHLANITRFPLQSLEEVADLPFTTPQDVRERGLSMLCVGQGEISRVVTLSTSGTTGEPKQLQFTGDDQDLTLGIFQSSMEQVARSGEACFVLLPCSTPSGVGDLLCTAIRKLGAHPIAHGAIANLKETALCMAEEDSCTLVGIPAQVLGELYQMQEAPIKSLWSLGRNMRQLYSARLALERGRGASYVADLWGLRSFQAEKIFTAARRFSLPWCRRAVVRCGEADLAMKSTGQDGQQLLTSLLLELSAPARKPALPRR